MLVFYDRFLTLTLLLRAELRKVSFLRLILDKTLLPRAELRKVSFLRLILDTDFVAAGRAAEG